MINKIIKRYSDDELIQLIKINKYSLFELEGLTGINHKKLKERLVRILKDKVVFKRGNKGGISIKD